jgi:hypothetical protein
MLERKLKSNITNVGHPVSEIIDPVFAKTSPKRSFSITEYERCGLVFMKTRVYKFGHWYKRCAMPESDA